MPTVVISSKNPVKVNATKQAFALVFPDQTFDFVEISAESGVSNQPLSNQETQAGATNRVNNVAAAHPGADFYVGIEGGVEQVGPDMHSFAWVIIKGQNKNGQARTGTFFLPAKVAELIHQGVELGAADDIVFAKNNSKQQNGAVGILTGDVIDRTKYYLDAVVLALIPFRNPDLY